MEMERAAKPAQVVASIEDLLLKILSLLPTKDLLRFKSVSKRWRTLISDPNFCHLRNPNPNPAAGIILPPDGYHNEYEYVPFSVLNSRTFQLNNSYIISGSCNGLLLLESESNFCCHVYNPTTDSRSELPEPDGGWGILRYMTLVFDPVKSRHYNIVSIWSLEPSYKQPFIEMYSSETRSWGVRGAPFPAAVDFWDVLDGVYWNGAVHWLSDAGGGLYFKVEHQVFGKMPIVHSNTFGTEYYYFGNSCDHLHLIENRESGYPYDVYEMKRDYSEWFVKYRVDLGPIIAANPDMVINNVVGDHIFDFCLLNVIRGEAEEDAFLVVMTSHKIIRYNLVSGTFEDLCELEISRCLDLRGVEYIESICCV